MTTDRDYDTKAYEDGVRAGRQEMQAEIDRLKAEVETWVDHAKLAIWSDSEECKMLEAENERLRAALQEAKRVNRGVVEEVDDVIDAALTGTPAKEAEHE